MTVSNDTHTAIRGEKQWIRGVNVGGWLMAERFITPYLFAVNSCHLDGELCWYPGQIGKPKHAKICGKHCDPYQPHRVSDGNADFHPMNDQFHWDYPVDEYTLGQAFSNRTTARLYMERHWDTFVTKQDLLDLKNAGVTHLRVPLSYWIRGDVQPGEPYIPGGWKFFVRFGEWCREIGLEIWADLHGAPGSENGFDNSGHYLGKSTCEGWTSDPQNVQRTVDIVTDISIAIVDANIADVVTGFGLLNEPFLDCDQDLIHTYYEQAFDIVRKILGPDTSVFIGDMFGAWKFNNGWWIDEDVHYKTYLDSHPYHVFFEKGRAFTPRQHIAYVCRHNHQDTTSCCYNDPLANTIPSSGISRIVGEWSAAFDSLPTAMAPHIMTVIAKSGEAPYLNRTLSSARMNFMSNFVKAQMVAYEAKAEKISSGWLFWNFKMEGGAFAEWDFLRGIKEGWMPPIPEPTVASEDLYGSCYEIYNRTNDEYNLIVDEYPDPRNLDWSQYQGWDANDDFVLSDPNIPTFSYQMYTPSPWYASSAARIAFIISCCIALLAFRRRQRVKRTERMGYEHLK